jgi:hypothetical protein
LGKKKFFGGKDVFWGKEDFWEKEEKSRNSYSYNIIRWKSLH